MDPGNSSPVSASHASHDSTDLHRAIRRRAEEIYIRGGKIPGHDLENWIQAEQEILRESPARRTAVVIDIDGVQYVGEYNLNTSEGYRPGEFQVGDDVAVRFDAEKMYVLRRSGHALETTVVKRICQS